MRTKSSVLKLVLRTFLILAIFSLLTCIDPYVPKLTEYESLLVVDGLITNANSSYQVRLSRTFQDLNADPVYETGATVSITDDAGNRYDLSYKGNGIYKTDSTRFNGIVGRTYTLHVLTSADDEFESDPCLLQAVPAIDSVFFNKDEELVNNQTESDKGIRIYVNSQTENNKYFRWTYDETWKFKVSNPKKYEYIHGSSPNSPLIVPIPDVKEFCWKNHLSDEILIESLSEGQPEKIQNVPLKFIATAKSDRLLIQYSILVKQYSISKDEYDFWNNMKQINETGGDIFAKQPYSVLSNVHNLKNPTRRVLGYFQVSSVTEKRKNITYREIAPLDLPEYSYTCETRQYQPSDFDTRCMCPPKTWDDVYWYLSIASDYTFVRPIYEGLSDSILSKLEFTRPECADCALTGSHSEPDFWHEFD